jgi:DNA polymerase III gamma/tau subunit
MLGTVDRQQVLHLVERLADRDARGLFGTVAAIDEYAPDYAQLLDELAALLQKVALRQAVPGLDEDGVWPAEALPRLPSGCPQRTCSWRTSSRSSGGATWTSRPIRARASR